MRPILTLILDLYSQGHKAHEASFFASKLCHYKMDQAKLNHKLQIKVSLIRTSNFNILSISSVAFQWMKFVGGALGTKGSLLVPSPLDCCKGCGSDC
jgi:hypothetical protein